MSDHLITCDASGFVCKRSEARMMWNGMLVRKDFWEPRHPQDFLPTIKDGSRPVDVRLDQADPDLDNCNVYYDYLADYEEMFSYDCPPNFNVNMII